MTKAVELVEVVLAVEGAIKRRPEPWRKAVTYFSRLDVWLFQEVVDARTCEDCRRFADHGEFRGHHLRANFPYLDVLDVNTVKANVHPNCRCYLIKQIGEEEPKEPEPTFNFKIDPEVSKPQKSKTMLTQLVNELPARHVEDVTRFRVVKKSPYRNYGEYDGVEIRIREDALEQEHGRHILYHEVGHHVWYDDLTQDDRDKWRRIWYRAPMPTQYAKYAPRNQVEEGFAECYSICYNKLSKFKLNIEVKRFIEEVKNRRG